MFFHAAILPAFVLGTLAESSTTTVNMFGGTDGWIDDDAAFAGSVFAVGASQTTYVVKCTSGASADCLTDFPITVTQGPSMFRVALATSLSGASVMYTESCKFAGTTSAACVERIEGGLDGIEVVESGSETFTGTDVIFYPVTITAGAEKLAAATTT